MNKTWTFYDPAGGGVLSGATWTGPEANLAQATPAGLSAYEGRLDHKTQRLDLTGAQPAVVAYTPPAAATPALALRQQAARVDRDQRLSAVDWIVTRAVSRAESVPSDWVTYMQALRDVPTQAGFPDSITWPTAPSS